MTKDVVVSIICITYNHEKFIRDTLLGFVNQKTNFPFEAIIGDDCSVDKTSEIIREFENKYPDIIKPVYRKKNIGARKNWIDVFNKCKGKYIAICEGDDYWINQYKLQKQVDFLDSNPDFAMCSHDVKTVFEGVENKDPFVESQKVSTFDDIVEHGHFIPTLSIMFRKKALPVIPEWFNELWVGDIPFVHLITHYGKNYHMDDIMGLKRKHKEGISQKPTRQDLQYKEYLVENKLFFYKKLNEFFEYEHKKVLNPIISRHYLNVAFLNFKYKLYKKFILDLIRGFFYSPFIFFEILFGNKWLKIISG